MCLFLQGSRLASGGWVNVVLTIVLLLSRKSAQDAAVDCLETQQYCGLSGPHAGNCSRWANSGCDKVDSEAVEGVLTANRRLIGNH